MSWFRVQLTSDQILTNEHINLQNAFHKLYIENIAPNGMALFSEKFEWEDQPVYYFCFSPASMQFAQSLVSSYSGVPCEQPKKEEMRLLVGRQDDFDLLK